MEALTDLGHTDDEYDRKYLLHIGRNISRANAINLDVVLTPLITESFRELPYSTFGRSIRRDSNSALEGKKRAEIDNFTPTKGYHVSAGSLRQEPDGLEIDIKHLIVVNDVIAIVPQGKMLRRKATLGAC